LLKSSNNIDEVKKQPLGCFFLLKTWACLTVSELSF
jgi:hypothetical protein